MTVIDGSLFTPGEFAEIDQLRELNLDPNDPLIGNEYYIDIINAQEAWNISTGDTIVLVSAPDTGIRSSHEDLQDVLRMDLAFNTVDNSDDTSPVHSHGTSTAGMISARTDNLTGIASAQWADTLHHIPIRVSNRSDGNAYDSDIVEAIEYAADHGAKSISISYSGVGSSARREAGVYARNLGALFFNSAGNGYGWEDPQG